MRCSSGAFSERAAGQTDPAAVTYLLPVLEAPERILEPSGVPWVVPWSARLKTGFVIERQRAHGTGISTPAAASTVLLDAEVDRFVVLHGHISENLAQAGRGSEFPGNELVGATQLAQPCVESERNTLSNVVHAGYGLIAQASNELRERRNDKHTVAVA